MVSKKALIFILFAAALISCKSPQIISERIVKDSVVYRDVEKPVFVPGFTSSGPTVNPDSVKAWLAAGIKPQIISEKLFYTDPQTLARVGFLVDELGNLTALCEQQDRIINALVQEKETYRFEFERIIEKEKRNLFQKLKDFIKWFFIGLGGGTLLFLGFKFRNHLKIFRF